MSANIDGVVRVAVTGMSAPYLTFAQQDVGPRYGFIGSWSLAQFRDVVFRTQNINR